MVFGRFLVPSYLHHHHWNSQVVLLTSQGRRSEWISTSSRARWSRSSTSAARCAATRCRATTTVCSPARAARVSSKGPCRTRRCTRASRTGIASSTRRSASGAPTADSRSVWKSAWNSKVRQQFRLLCSLKMYSHLDMNSKVCFLETSTTQISSLYYFCDNRCFHILGTNELITFEYAFEYSVSYSNVWTRIYVVHVWLHHLSRLSTDGHLIHLVVNIYGYLLLGGVSSLCLILRKKSG